MAATNGQGRDASSSAPTTPLASAVHSTVGQVSTQEDDVVNTPLPILLSR